MPRQVLDQMWSLANTKSPLETGGVLLGYVGGADHEDVLVAAVTGPGPRASHEEYAFEPDHEYQVGEIARIYRASKGVNTYLGDWHTHPRSKAALSSLDKKTLKHIASHTDARIEQPIMAILGSGVPWLLKAWRLTPGRLLPPRATKYREMNIREIFSEEKK
jgi:integrative and conjugative element protein (TIGR02256 family)